MPLLLFGANMSEFCMLIYDYCNALSHLFRLVWCIFTLLCSLSELSFVMNEYSSPVQYYGSVCSEGLLHGFSWPCLSIFGSCWGSTNFFHPSACSFVGFVPTILQAECFRICPFYHDLHTLWSRTGVFSR